MSCRFQFAQKVSWPRFGDAAQHQSLEYQTAQDLKCRCPPQLERELENSKARFLSRHGKGLFGSEGKLKEDLEEIQAESPLCSPVSGVGETPSIRPQIPVTCPSSQYPFVPALPCPPTPPPPPCTPFRPEPTKPIMATWTSRPFVLKWQSLPSGAAKLQRLGDPSPSSRILARC